MSAIRHKSLFILLILNTLCNFSIAGETDYIDSLILKTQSTKNEKLAELQNEIAFSYYENGDMKNAILWGQKSIQTAKKNKNTSDEAKALKTIGLCEKFNGNIDKAFEIFKNAAELHLKVNDKKNYASCLSQQATCYYRKSQISSAIEYATAKVQIFTNLRRLLKAP